MSEITLTVENVEMFRDGDTIIGYKPFQYVHSFHGIWEEYISYRFMVYFGICNNQHRSTLGNG